MPHSKAAIGHGYFTESTSAEVVIARNADCQNPRLKSVMAVITHKLHEAVKEIEPTEEERTQALQFLTRTGQICNDWRQEWILFSDIMGVSMLVDAVNHQKPNGGSENTVLGPLHVTDAPEMQMGENICLDGKGEDMAVSGIVADTEGRPLSGVRLDVWQANDEGLYDVQQKGIQPDFNLRGVCVTGHDGRYWFKAVKPRYYPIPEDGPVSQLLGHPGRHPYRPAHLHFILQADGVQSLTIHIFDPHRPYINSDAVSGVKESLLADFRRVDDAGKAQDLGFKSGWCWTVDYDFVLAR